MKLILQAGEGGKGSRQLLSAPAPPAQHRRLRGPALLHCHHFFHPRKPPRGTALYSSPRTKVPSETLKQQGALHKLRQRCLSPGSDRFFFPNFTKRVTDNAAEGTLFLHSYQELPRSKHRSQENAGALLPPALSRTAWQLGEDWGFFSQSAN